MVVSWVFDQGQGLHKAWPNYLGGWYFTGNYPNVVVFSPEDLSKPHALCSYTYRMFHFSEAGGLAAVVETT